MKPARIAGISSRHYGDLQHAAHAHCLNRRKTWPKSLILMSGDIGGCVAFLSYSSPRSKTASSRLSQGLVAEFFGVSYHAISDWEANVVSPAVKSMPKVIEFLGYVPFNDLSEMSEGERIRASRKLLGLTRDEAARQLGICPTTLSSWENGRGIRKKSYMRALEPFITSACRVRMIGG
jgi:transcriptional regulator with XRE-family HTH domain